MARVYRNIETPVRVFGLELMDLLFVIVFFLVLFNISNHIFINSGLLILFYSALRALKVGKPAGYALHLVRFLLSPTVRHVTLKDSRPPYLSKGKSL